MMWRIKMDDKKYSMGDYNLKLDPELQKLIEQKMAMEQVNTTTPSPFSPSPYVDSNYSLSKDTLPPEGLKAASIPPAALNMDESLKNKLYEKLLSQQKDSEAFEASKAKAAEDAGPAGWQKGLGYVAAGLQGMATGGQNLSLAGDLNKGWKADKAAAVAGVKDPSEGTKKILDDYIKLKALGEDSFENKKKLKEMEIEAADKRLQSDRAFQSGLVDKKAGIEKEAELRKPTEGVKTMDREFSKQMADWSSRDKGSYLENKKIFNNVISDLENKKLDTGWWSGVKTSVGGKVGYVTDVAEAQNKVRAAVQSMLRPILGGQFAAEEGERVIKSSFNPQASPESNIESLKRELNKIEYQNKTMESKAKYFNQNNSLKGWDENYTGEAAPSAGGSPWTKYGGK